MGRSGGGVGEVWGRRKEEKGKQTDDIRIAQIANEQFVLVKGSLVFRQSKSFPFRIQPFFQLFAKFYFAVSFKIQPTTGTEREWDREGRRERKREIKSPGKGEKSNR